jgi:hypothetical protein
MTVHIHQHMNIRKLKINALARNLLYVSTIKPSSSVRLKYKEIHNSHTLIYLV